MKVAIIGSRNLKINCLEKYLPKNTTEIVSGGAKGIDNCAKEFAITNNIKLAEFLPDYKRYGKGAPLKRNIQIIEYADLIIAFWDGKSKGTKFVIDNCQKRSKKIEVYIV
ncbi:MAG: DUF2493 domain-containing protein [Ruminococcaceae bacterium]|nr:DUF2493 domain-containing protein [Oscillospiraceae bacterium]